MLEKWGYIGHVHVLKHSGKKFSLVGQEMTGKQTLLCTRNHCVLLEIRQIMREQFSSRKQTFWSNFHKKFTHSNLKKKWLQNKESNTVNIVSEKVQIYVATSDISATELNVNNFLRNRTTRQDIKIWQCE